MNKYFKINFFLFLFVFLMAPFFVGADSLGQKKDFYIAYSYDLTEREQVTAILQEKTSQLYFYIDNSWWTNLNSSEQSEVKAGLSSLSSEFENKIYPILTSAYGFEWKPGIDADERITILIHPMKQEVGGYVRTEDEYPRIQAPRSNIREMLYLNADYITEPLAKSLLTHEFMHLITFNQKERQYDIEEEVWLNELRSEYAPTLLGYDDSYQGSNLERRVQIFLKNPNDSLTEWRNQKADYGALNLFAQYLVNHYGEEILIESLHYSKIGIESINYALKKQGFEKDFSQIFQDWVNTLFINDCGLGGHYCYLNKNLENFQITPSLNFLPFTGKSSLTIQDSIKDWSGRWYKIVGGKGDLNLEFDGNDQAEFKISYFACDLFNNCSLKFLFLNEEQKGNIVLSDFGKKYTFLTVIISVQEKVQGFGESEMAYPFTLKAVTAQEEDQTIEVLLAQINTLKAEIARIQARIQAILKQKPSCQKFENNLYYGLENNEVRCLQEFLKSQGPAVYPEAIVSGWFGPLTKSAVIRFQEKYIDEILTPYDLTRGTGFVGTTTRTKINQILSK
ncbi:hypothetical protein AMJ49_04740 [Parcubacteria bacterium DG_74_2]|nr:MAG: hypothetical protein AMJ49_04740 [Parcubacteria bacterium DG_74_2]